MRLPRTPRLCFCPRCPANRGLFEPQAWPSTSSSFRRHISHSRTLFKDEASETQSPSAKRDDGEQQPEQGAMSRRLEALSEDGLESGGRSAVKAVQEAGFDPELLRRLEERIANAGFRSDNASAFAQVEMPSSAGQGTRDMAAAAPWTGTESVGDASLRMLNDSIKPMRVPARPPPIRGPPVKVDTGRSRSKQSSGLRIANARDKTSTYAYIKDLPEDEREKYRKELKERFTPTGGTGPMTVKGLASMANQRIEDAIARGQFKNLPRGKQIEKDYTASSPFIDTTEYLLNKMIQKQEIVPPWIEKQQEVVATALRFRSRLRSDWRRHVARSISSKGGSIESQMKLAEEYAAAEAIANPQIIKEAVVLNTVDDAGHLSQISLAGELKAMPPDEDVELAADAPQVVSNGVSDTATVPEDATVPTERVPDSTVDAVASLAPKPTPTVRPFRDELWLKTERAYQQLAIENLNSLTRSYNLMCPALAQRPYYTLDRELNACYADVAPQVAKEIRDRAQAPKMKFDAFASKPASVIENLVGQQARVYDDRRPSFGFRELFREWFGKS